MKNKKKLYIIITMVILGILAIVGFSYAYFSGILGTGNDITISSARLGLIYEDGTSEISADASKPGSIYEKTFKATNSSDTVLKYNIEWTDVENTYVVKEELVYRIEKLDGTVVVEETVTPSEDGLIIGGITINPSEVHEYKLIIEFKNLENNSLDNMGKVFNGKIEINTDSYSTEFAYTGAPQTFTAPEDGYYEIEAWGASGGNVYTEVNVNGAYTYGKIYLTEGESIYVYVGNDGSITPTECIGYTQYNGGGLTGGLVGSSCGDGGGGATDIRLASGAWNDSSSLRSRIMVAGAGGGESSSYHGFIQGFGGGLIAYSPDFSPNASYKPYFGNGGTQTSGGIVPEMHTSASTNGTVGGFGYGGNGGRSGTTGGGGAGGSGYYGGSGASGLSTGLWPGAGGSSYISGYAGVNSVIETGGTAAQPLHTNNTIHYSGKYFIDPVMLTGAEKMLSIEGNEVVGNEGDGKAKITYLGKPIPKKITTDLDNVRYIKDCTNGNSKGNTNHWIELQAIYEGENIAKNKNVQGTVINTNNYDYAKVVDGDISNIGGSNSSDGIQCITVDLGEEYDLDEVVLWHYYQDGRSYNNHTLSVGTTNTSGTLPLSTALINNRSGVGTSSQGYKFSAYESLTRKYYSITAETVEGQSVLTPTSQSAGDKVAIVSQFTDSNLYGGLLIINADTNEQYLTVPKADTYFIMPAFDIKITPIINKSFSITKESVTGGSVSVATTGLSGSTVSFTTSQSTGYYYNGAMVSYTEGSINLTSAQKSFTMPSGNVTVTPIFAKYNYSITKATATGGSITSVIGTATYGQMVSFTTNQTTGYQYNGATVSYSGGSINLTSAQKSFAMPAANVTITPRFTKINYTVGHTPITGGTTSAVGTAQYGQAVTFTATPAAGFTYQGANIYTTGGTLYASIGTKTFTQPYFPVVIKPVWKYQNTTTHQYLTTTNYTWQKENNQNEAFWFNGDYESQKTLWFSKSTYGWSRQQFRTIQGVYPEHYASYTMCFYNFSNEADVAPANWWQHSVTITFGLNPTASAWIHEQPYSKSVTKVWPTYPQQDCHTLDITNATGHYFLAFQVYANNVPFRGLSDRGTLYGRTYS